MSERRLPSVFLSEFDVRVVADRYGVIYTIGLNEQAAWISELPTPYTRGTAAIAHARTIGNRLVFLARETCQVTRSPALMLGTINRDADRCVFVPLPMPAPSSAAVLLSFLGAFHDWPEVAQRLNDDRARMGLPLLTPETIG